MPAVTIDSVATPDAQWGAMKQKYKLYYRDVTVAANGDTYASGIRGIVDVWWGPSTSTDRCAPTWDSATGIITFNTGGAVVGSILIRAKS